MLTALLATKCVPKRPRTALAFFCGLLAGMITIQKNHRERGRRPKARLVAALVCVPQTLVLYEAVPLMLVPRTFWQSVALVTVSYIGHTWVRLHLPPGYHERLSYELVGKAMIWSLYLPCTIMVLRRRNEGRVPDWLERRIAGWPASLRGVPARQ